MESQLEDAIETKFHVSRNLSTHMAPTSITGTSRPGIKKRLSIPLTLNEILTLAVQGWS